MSKKQFGSSSRRLFVFCEDSEDGLWDASVKLPAQRLWVSATMSTVLYLLVIIEPCPSLLITWF